MKTHMPFNRHRFCQAETCVERLCSGA